MKSKVTMKEIFNVVLAIQNEVSGMRLDLTETRGEVSQIGQDLNQTRAELAQTRHELSHVRSEQKNFSTKDDLRAFATREDLKAFATREDLKAFATREDLKAFATKEDLKVFPSKTYVKFAVDQGIKSVRALFEKIEHDFKAAMEVASHYSYRCGELEKRVSALELRP